MIQKRLGLDSKDVKILTLYTTQPEISQTELAQALGISQPSVNARLKKLRSRGILASTTGMDVSKTDVFMMRADLATPNPDQLLDRLKHCSFFVNGFTLSGTRNVSILIMGYSLQKMESIIDTHLRQVPGVKDIQTSVVVSSAKPYVCALNLENEQHEQCQNPTSCKDCPMHRSTP
ncbi:winged helix-turn-helix transcriptional regulator [Candidatus Woesearchaeota archaeon]|nr:winged helix-turn-helix transcriptional regulator [Candidatus Woesearchaeota archaeon]